jgi:hypothetical protein
MQLSAAFRNIAQRQNALIHHDEIEEIGGELFVNVLLLLRSRDSLMVMEGS